MAALAQTVTEVRDQIMKRLKVEGSTDWETLILEMLNDSLVLISADYDWEYLRKKGTLTISGTGGTATMPADYDRALAIHQSGANRSLVKLDPIDFESAREDDTIDTPSFYCVTGYAQDTDVDAPRVEIEILSAPADATEYILWYVIRVDEITTAELLKTPNIPPHIWDLTKRLTTLEGLKMIHAPNTTIAREEKHFILSRDLYRRREQYGGTHYGSIKQRGDVASYYASRMK